MNIALIGAGYVGKELLKHFKQKPYDFFITTTSKEKEPFLAPFGSVVYLGEDSQEKLTSLFSFCDAAIILAAPKGQSSYEETYLFLAKKISTALQGRLKPFYLIYTSSTSVCEGIDSQWVTEEISLNPSSTNGKILAETENIYLNLPFDTCILRLAGIFGPGRELALRAQRFSGKDFPSAGDSVTNHIHLDDIVKAIAFCLEKRLTGVYHLANDAHPTRRELYDDLCQKQHLAAPLWPQNAPSKGSSSKICNKKIKEAGFIFSHPDLL